MICSPPSPHSVADSCGFWFYNGDRDLIHLDATCRHLLGLPPERASILRGEIRYMFGSIGENTSLDDILLDADMGDRLRDTFLVRSGPRQGSVLVAHGTVLLRNEQNRAIMVGGSLHSVATPDRQALLLPPEEENRLFPLPDQGTLPFPFASEDGLWDWNPQTDAFFFNQHYRAMLGYASEQELPNDVSSWVDALHPDDRTHILALQRTVALTTERGDYFECCCRLRHKEGRFLWVMQRGQVVQRDAQNRATRIIALHTDLSLHRRIQASLRHKALTDSLTDLYNREFLAQNAPSWNSELSLPLSVIYCDVSGLKLINDTLGHDQGDRLLIAASRLLQRSIRAPHSLIRLGGDEFIIILPTCTADQAEEHTLAIQRSLREHNRNNNGLPLFLGIGHATWNGEDAADLYSTIHAADIRMQEKKRLHHADAFTFLRYWLEYHTGKPIKQRDNRCSSRA